jgi:hypothetical protein
MDWYRRNFYRIVHLESELENPEHVDPRMGFSEWVPAKSSLSTKASIALTGFSLSVSSSRYEKVPNNRDESGLVA